MQSIPYEGQSMNNTVLSVEGICKTYRLGVINHGFLYRDLQSWWARKMGRPDPNAQINFNGGSENFKSGVVNVLKNVSFELKKGEAVGVIGRNGAGKSTLLKILSRITSPTAGVIKYNGRVASLLEVGTGFHPDLTGRENIYLNGAILGMTKAEIRSSLDDIIEFSGVGKYIDTPVKRYSSGMYVRLAFSVAAHLDADILILDEVLAVGDAEFQKKCIEKLDGVAKSGKTIIFVSHNPIAIRRFCTRLIYLEGGEVKRIGGVDEVLSEYQSYMLENSKNADLEPTRALGKRAAIIGFHVVKKINQGLSISIRLTSREFLRGVQLYVNVIDLDGTSVMFFDSSIDDNFVLNLNGSSNVELSVDNCYTLPSGRYLFNFALVFNGEWLDHVENIGQVDWEYEDFFKSGKIPYHKSVFYPKHAWSLEGNK